MKKLYLTNGKEILVDDDKYEMLSKYQWSERGNGYAATTINHQSFYMHRLIIGAKIGEEVDHVNRNRLDNRIENLRLCSHSQNQANQAIKTRNTTGYIGVTWHKSAQKYQARIRIDGVKTHLGLFNNPVDAAIAYNEMAKKVFGDFAQLNEMST